MCTHAREVIFMILPREPKVLLYPRASATTVVEHYTYNTRKALNSYNGNSSTF